MRLLVIATSALIGQAPARLLARWRQEAGHLTKQIRSKHAFFPVYLSVCNDSPATSKVEHREVAGKAYTFYTYLLAVVLCSALLRKKDSRMDPE